jgi:hypothetical protein
MKWSRGAVEQGSREDKNSEKRQRQVRAWIELPLPWWEE